MKPRSAFFVVAMAAIGFAFVIPQASALPGSKSAPAHRFHNHKKQEKKVKTQKRQCKEATCVRSAQKAAEPVAKKGKKKLRPYFERKRGAPAFGRRR